LSSSEHLQSITFITDFSATGRHFQAEFHLSYTIQNSWNSIITSLLYPTLIIHSSQIYVQCAYIYCWLKHKNIKGKVTCSYSKRVSQIFEGLFFVIKPTRCTNFTNLSCHETLHVWDSWSVQHQEFIHCRQLWNRTWSCSKAVYKPVWHIPLLSI
jgi:hypothetical protein